MKRLPVLVLALSLVTACGSTVQVRGTSTVQGGGDGLTGQVAGSSTGAGSTGGAATGTSGATGPGGPTGPAGSTGSSTGSLPSVAAGSAGSGTTGVGGGNGSTAGAVGAATGRGFTRTTISIGVATANDYNTTASGFGLKGVGYEGDPNVWFQAAVDDINRRGGLLGRRIVLVKHDYSTAQELNDPASANQAACTHWTQDKPVYAVLLAGFLVEDTLLTCLAKASTPLIYPGAGLDYPLHYSQSYRTFPLFFNLAQMVGERFDRIAIGRLVARGFFGPWDTRNGAPGTAATPVKIGIIGFDDRDGDIQLADQKKELARHGLAPSVVIQCPRALTNKVSCEQSAVLRFGTNGVTHVFGADTTFMQNANSQRYRPRYFVHVSTAAFAANVPASQLGGAMGEGYIPFNDVDTSDFPGDPTPATTACRKLMKSVGQVSTDPTTLTLQMSVCEEFNFLRAGVLRAGALGATALKAGLEGLGSSQPSTLTWSSVLTPADHTSATVLRDLTYKPDLQRFVYVNRTNYGES